MNNRILNIAKLINHHLELLMWIGALVSLIFVNPYETDHFTFCIFNQMGIDFCPGCGIGRSITMIYHGNFADSFRMHPLGIFALAVILYRIINLLPKHKLNLKRG